MARTGRSGLGQRSTWVTELTPDEISSELLVRTIQNVDQRVVEKDQCP